MRGRRREERLDDEVGAMAPSALRTVVGCRRRR
jgi:hypothetical protein